MTMFFTRHCKTEWNLENRLQGSVDVPLCQAGVDEAIANFSKVASLGIELVVSSPLLRATETAEIYAERLRVPLEICEAVREIDHGLWEGQLISELMSDPHSGYKRWMQDPGRVPIPGGSETIPQAQERIIDGIVSLLEVRAEATMLVVSHKHILALLRCVISGDGTQHFHTLIPEAVEPFTINSSALMNASRNNLIRPHG